LLNLAIITLGKNFREFAIFLHFRERTTNEMSKMVYTKFLYLVFSFKGIKLKNYHFLKNRVSFFKTLSNFR